MRSEPSLGSVLSSVLVVAALLAGEVNASNVLKLTGRVRWNGGGDKNGRVIFSGTLEGDTLRGTLHGGSLRREGALVEAKVGADTSIAGVVTTKSGTRLGTFAGTLVNGALVGTFATTTAARTQLPGSVPQSGTFESRGMGLKDAPSGG